MDPSGSPTSRTSCSTASLLAWSNTIKFTVIVHLPPLAADHVIVGWVTLHPVVNAPSVEGPVAQLYLARGDQRQRRRR